VDTREILHVFNCWRALVKPVSQLHRDANPFSAMGIKREGGTEEAKPSR